MTKDPRDSGAIKNWVWKSEGLPEILEKFLPPTGQTEKHKDQAYNLIEWLHSEV